MDITTAFRYFEEYPELDLLVLGGTDYPLGMTGGHYLAEIVKRMVINNPLNFHNLNLEQVVIAEQEMEVENGKDSIFYRMEGFVYGHELGFTAWSSKHQLHTDRSMGESIQYHRETHGDKFYLDAVVILREVSTRRLGVISRTYDVFRVPDRFNPQTLSLK
jgi:hypothetical protein